MQKAPLAGKDRTEFATYKEYSSNQKLFFWYCLAQEMEQGNAVQVPNDYRLSPDAQQLLDAVRKFKFSQKLVFIRDVVGLGAAQTLQSNV
ncbi:MAG TPA: orange carotenoid protein N-terminal domain-containing protein [Coleofasciculaceae cyanobacterium]